MKKILGILVSVCFLALPMFVGAAKDIEKIDITKYQTTNLKETLAAEKIEEKFKTYSDSDDKINIYLFRGNGCHYCQGFLEYLNGITDEYGKYFNLVAFETWYNQDNAELVETLSDFLGEKVSGVPYIIIGNQVFPGYAEEYNDAIEAKIKEEYNAKERYDVIVEYNKAVDEAAKAENRAQNRVIIYCFAFCIISTCATCFYVNYSNKKILEAIKPKNAFKEVVKDVNNEVNEIKKDVTEKVKKVTKKTKK